MSRPVRAPQVRHPGLRRLPRQGAAAVGLAHLLRLLEAAVHQLVEGELGAVEVQLAREIVGQGAAQAGLVLVAPLQGGEVAAHPAADRADPGANRRPAPVAAGEASEDAAGRGRGSPRPG